MKRITCLAFAFFVFAATASAQLSGIKTIGGSTPDYVTIAAAITDLNTQGVSGPVIFNIRNGTYTESGTPIINNITGASAVNTITFQSENLDSTLVVWVSSSSSINGVVKLNGASYITIRKITMKATVGSGDYSLCINIIGAGTDVHIENNVITGRPSTSFADPYGDILYSAGHNNLVVKNNVFNSGQKAMYIGGGSGAVVDGNTFNTHSDYAVYFAGGTAPTVSKNIMTVRGVYMSNVSAASQIIENKITGLVGGYGIYLSGCNGSSPGRGLIANNFIQVGGTGTAYGIYDSVSTNFDILYNSVHLSSTGSGSAIRITGGTGNTNNIINNIFFNSGGGLAYNVVTPAALVISDYNDLFSYGAVLARWNGVDHATLASLQVASGLDANSKSANPDFTSVTDLHAASAAINDAGTDLQFIVWFDIDGQGRSATAPDIGADEFTPAAIDAAIYTNAVVAPIVPFAAGNQPVIITLTNNGSSTITSATIDWWVNSVLQTPFTFNGSLTSGNTTNVTVGNYNFVSGKEYIIAARVSNPNGSGTDADATNDSSAFANRGPMLCGSFTVYGASPDYLNLTTAITALQNWGMSCPVAFNLRTGVYNNQARISINPIYGSSAVNTVTITSETGNAADVTYGAMNSATGIFNLSGANHFIFRDLTMTSQSFTELIISVSGATKHFEAYDNIFNAYTSSNVLQYSATLYSSADTTIIKGNTFNSGQHGLFLAYSNGKAFWKVQCNRFNNNTTYSMVLTNNLADSIIISSNIISNLNGSAINMSAVNASYFILKNRIYGSTGGTGINILNCALAGADRGLVANNFIQTGSGASTAYGIYINNSTNTDVYFNNVNLTSTSATNGRALYVNGGTGNTNNLVNNVFANTGGGYAYYVSTPAAINNSSYNDIYSSGAAFAEWGALSYVNLAALQTASGKNANSLSIDPIYTSSVDLHVGAFALQAAGTTLADVSEDYDDQVRATPPTIGADETPNGTTSADPSCFINIPTAVNPPVKNSEYGLSVFPNPAMNEISVISYLLSGGDGVIVIYNVLGEKVYGGNLQTINHKPQTAVNVSAFPAGLYFIQVENNGEKMLGKFIKE